MDGTYRGSDDAFTVRQFIKGNVYDTRGEGEFYISDSLARSFIREKKAHEQTWEEWIERLETRRREAGQPVDSLVMFVKELERTLRPVPCNPATTSFMETVDDQMKRICGDRP